MKRHLECAEQQVSPSNLTKYCACHEKLLDCFIVLTYETSFPMRGATGVTIQPRQILRLPRKMTLQDFKENLQKQVKRHFQCGADPTMIRAWSEHDPRMKTQTATRLASEVGYFARSPEAFSIVKYNVLHPILQSNFHQILRLPRKVTLQLHQVLRLPRKVPLERHQVLHLPRKVTNPQRHTTFWNIYFQISYTYQTQPWQSANADNIAFRSSLVFVAAVRKNIRPEETFTVISPTLNKHNHCSPQRHTIFLFDFLFSSWPQSAKTYDLKKHLLSDLLHVTSTTIAVRKDIIYSARNNRCHDPTAANTAPVTQKDSHLSPHHIWNVIYSARSNRCHDPTSPNTAPVTQKASHT